MLAAYESVFLCRVHIVDKSFLGLEVVEYGVQFILVLSHGHYGHAPLTAFLGGVGCAGGIYQTAVQVHVDTVALHLHALIVHLGRAVEVGAFALGVIHQGVLRRVFHGSVDARRLGTVEGVLVDGVVDVLVVAVDGELDGVHLCGIHLGGAFVVHRDDVDSGETVFGFRYQNLGPCGLNGVGVGAEGCRHDFFACGFLSYRHTLTRHRRNQDGYHHK